ncbi:adenosylcobinamide-phosphate synthase CbiB [Pseudooceanicola aestuarii]|uniref:adenosylcobinamide-phosphate synthase CbiB n=1 Tax=Pseudooceanicola aestuarii TaxID=2697319 RepID=UPI0013D25CA5|nr:adenosylcobinamide-phosphate synthase CbiB [Pseudooceanicola aestuarii]
MSTALILTLALCLDALLGEPRRLWTRLPHPVVLMGRLIDWADKRFNTAGRAGRNGLFLALGLVALGWGAGHLLGALGWGVELALATALLAHRSLVDHVSQVAQALRGSVTEGRRAVARIVGRETAALDGPAVARAAIESAAENASDGIVAPAFWFLIGGLPGLLIYKLVNTADSMIGHRTPRHRAFGAASARLDDLLNLVPARITGLILAALSARLSDWREITDEARRHRSPNAGWAEAAMARAVDTALSGPRIYDGVPTDDPFIHPGGARHPDPARIDAAVAVLWRLWAVLVLGSAGIALF